MTEAGVSYTCLVDGTSFAAPSVEVFQPAEVEVSSVAAPSPPRAKAATKRKVTYTSRDVIRDARRELKELNAEIARLKKLIPQRDAIQRLLDAASDRPPAANSREK